MHNFVFGSIIGRIMYSKEYFPKGKWFEHWYSIGYSWVLPDFWGRILLKRNKGVKWPCSPLSNIGKNIEFNVDDLNNFQGNNNYFQTWDAKIYIGVGSYIASGVGIITSNHDINDLGKRSKIQDVIIGEKCWIGMNSVILPGVKLGNHTIVGAGAVVTKSFPEGNCILAGNPARVIKVLDENS